MFRPFWGPDSQALFTTKIGLHLGSSVARYTNLCPGSPYYATINLKHLWKAGKYTPKFFTASFLPCKMLGLEDDSFSYWDSVTFSKENSL